MILQVGNQEEKSDGPKSLPKELNVEKRLKEAPDQIKTLSRGNPQQQTSAGSNQNPFQRVSMVTNRRRIKLYACGPNPFRFYISTLVS